MFFCFATKFMTTVLPLEKLSRPPHRATSVHCGKYKPFQVLSKFTVGVNMGTAGRVCCSKCDRGNTCITKRQTKS